MSANPGIDMTVKVTCEGHKIQEERCSNSPGSARDPEARAAGYGESRHQGAGTRMLP